MHKQGGARGTYPRPTTHNIAFACRIKRPCVKVPVGLRGGSDVNEADTSSHVSVAVGQFLAYHKSTFFILLICVARPSSLSSYWSADAENSSTATMWLHGPHTQALSSICCAAAPRSQLLHSSYGHWVSYTHHEQPGLLIIIMQSNINASGVARGGSGETRPVLLGRLGFGAPR
eukprot:SAG11_NODE_2237_length_3650_cov_49.920867_1_plen_174_part_00